MSRRRQANRAEAIVRGIGALLLLFLLAAMVFAMPQILKGQSPNEMIGTMLHMVMAFAILVGAVIVMGLVVWIIVLRRRK